MGEQKTGGNAWGDPISDERKAELKALADKQQEWVAQPKAARGDSVFKGVKLTGADVYWLAEKSGRNGLGAVPNLHLEEANIHEAHLEEANLDEAHLEGANLSYAYLEGASFMEAHLGNASLRKAHLEGAYLAGAYCEEANLAEAYFDRDTYLAATQLNGAFLGHVTFDDADLSLIEWSSITTLGEEVFARKSKDLVKGHSINSVLRLGAYQGAVRVNRLLAVSLRSQGMNEEADHFAYRVQVLQRQVLWRQRKPFQALLSLFLDALAGHGYRPQRSIITYLLAIFSFGIAYYFIGQVVGPHLSPLGAFVFSMTSFHGRGFFPGGIALDDPITVLAAFEAFEGLVIEVSFIATFTQRFFAR